MIHNSISCKSTAASAAQLQAQVCNAGAASRYCADCGKGHNWQRDQERELHSGSCSDGVLTRKQAASPKSNLAFTIRTCAVALAVRPTVRAHVQTKSRLLSNNRNAKQESKAPQATMHRSCSYNYPAHSRLG